MRLPFRSPVYYFTNKRKMKKSTENKEQDLQPKNISEIVIAIKGLKKSFGEKHVLKDITLDVNRGENVVILGRSGTGKSVTIQCIIGLLKQDEGSLKVLGEEVASM